MDQRQEYVSPDGILRLLVIRDENDFTIGFDGYGWHTHGDVIAGELQLIGEPELLAAEAVKRFVTDLVGEEVAVCIYRTDGRITDIAATYVPEENDPYLGPGESLEIRTWSGAAWRSD
jgi:hypothetical protein